MSFEKNTNNEFSDVSKNRLHYGFVAQNVKEFFPELVYEDSEGILSIDYVSFIPILVAKLKDQDKIIGEMKNEIDNLKKIAKSSLTIKSDEEINEISELYQNYPNPFNENTTIKFKLPRDINKASLNVYDLNGNQLRSYTINPQSEASIIINGSELKPGMYLYTLIADEKVVDTKSMVLTQ